MIENWLQIDLVGMSMKISPAATFLVLPSSSLFFLANMKLSVALVSFAISVVFAAPPLNPRQNDVPDCEDGGSAEHLEVYKNGKSL